MSRSFNRTVSKYRFVTKFIIFKVNILNNFITLDLAGVINFLENLTENRKLQ